MQSFYTVSLWRGPDVLKSIFNKAASEKRERNPASSVKRIISEILLAFKQSPLLQEDSVSMKEICSMRLPVSLFALQYLMLITLGFSALPSCQGLLFIAPSLILCRCGGWDGGGEKHLVFLFCFLNGKWWHNGITAQKHTSDSDVLHLKAIQWCAGLFLQKGLFVSMTGSVWQFWQPALLWKSGLIQHLHGRRCTAHDIRIKWEVTDKGNSTTANPNCFSHLCWWFNHV